MKRGGLELVDFFKKINFTEGDFRGLKTNSPKYKKSNGRVVDTNLRNIT